MDMWNWLLGCYLEGSLTLEELEYALEFKGDACFLWEDFSEESEDFVEYVRDQIRPFIEYVKKKEAET